MPLSQNFFAVGPLTAQCELTSSLSSTPVTLCCPDPEPYLTSCECSRIDRCTFISFTTDPHVTLMGFRDKTNRNVFDKDCRIV